MSLVRQTPLAAEIVASPGIAPSPEGSADPLSDHGEIGVYTLDVKAWYETHSEALLRFAFALCRNRTLADDIVQEACLRLITCDRKFASEGEVNGYVFRVIRNRITDEWRRKAVRDAFAACQQYESQDQPDYDPGAELQQEEMSPKAREIAREAIEKMSENERSALTVWLLLLSRTQAAEALGISKRQYSMRLTHALKKLRAVCNQHINFFREFESIRFLEILAMELKRQ